MRYLRIISSSILVMSSVKEGVKEGMNCIAYVYQYRLFSRNEVRMGDKR